MLLANFVVFQIFDNNLSLEKLKGYISFFICSFEEI